MSGTFEILTGKFFLFSLPNHFYSPIELIEKHMDIFSLKSTEKQLFMGCRNHSIVPMGLGHHSLFQDQVQAPIKQPHLDVVTSFATLLDEKILISASKDKNLRGWSTTQAMPASEPQQNVKQLHNLTTNSAHRSDINVLESSHDNLEMYSGSKDGIVHIWNLRESPKQIREEQNWEEQLQSTALQRVGSLQGQGSAVTAIAALEPSFGQMIIYGSLDRSLRICKRRESQEHLADLGQYADFRAYDDDLSEDRYRSQSAVQHMEQIEHVPNMKPSKSNKQVGSKTASSKYKFALDLEGMNQQ